ncbi:hypothetical protein [Paenibacillus sp. R14(2021)]|uniref:hypothetical protein n=1 Tax=Paenibacillus sp. R14(2021) TaxID=2859228 RepID=UPI001C613829|nr:hypothetical protein [Paenibacillus sp. R14(2021)]
MKNQQNEVSKADVQSSELNKLPVPGQDDTEFSAEEAADAFKQDSSCSTMSEAEH